MKKTSYRDKDLTKDYFVKHGLHSSHFLPKHVNNERLGSCAKQYRFNTDNTNFISTSQGEAF